MSEAEADAAMMTGFNPLDAGALLQTCRRTPCHRPRFSPVVSIPSMPGRFFRHNSAVTALGDSNGFNPLDAGALLQTRRWRPPAA